MSISWGETYAIAKDWQTLIAGLIALLAALLTIRAMRLQAKGDQERHLDLLDRKEMASRARMPDALSGMGEHVRRIGSYLAGEVAELPDTPINSISALKEVIEHIDNDAAQRTFELVSWYQVLRARVSSDAATLREEETLYDLVLLQAYVNSLYDYARNEKPKGPNSDPSVEEMSNAVKNAFDISFRSKNGKTFDDLQELIERRHPKS